MKQPISKFREHLERQIVATAYFMPACSVEMCTILNEHNFQHTASRFIYVILRTCFERGEAEKIYYLKEISARKSEINPTDVYAVLEEDFKDDLIREKCLMLIELDMRDKFGTALKQNELVAVANQDFPKAAVWKNAFDFIHNKDKDIFEAIPSLHQYLKTYATPEEIADFSKMESLIPAMVDRVRGTERVRRFIDTLTALAGSSDFEPDRRECIELLKELLITCVARLPIPQDLNVKLTDFKRNLWTAPAPQQVSRVSTNF